ASTGLLLVLLTNLVGCLNVALRCSTPAFAHLFDQRYLALLAWGFLVPFVWGFSAKWMAVFLGLKPPRTEFLIAALVTNWTGLGIALSGVAPLGLALAGGGVRVVERIWAIGATGVLDPAVNEPKTRGVHGSFPLFIRMAYVWLVVAGVLGVAASRWDTSGGIWGASRHAL